MQHASASNAGIEPADHGCNRKPWAEIDRSDLAEGFRTVRNATESLAADLSAEDQNLQSMPETSPVKWHRAHTTWFFEAFILKPMAAGYQEIDPEYNYLYNSYYNGVGRQFPRPQRGLISRPDVAAVSAYRKHVDEAMLSLIANLPAARFDELRRLLVLGLNHEQQHQELIVTDLKHGFSINPLQPQWVAPCPAGPEPAPLKWQEFTGGIHWVGSDQEHFCFDNETPSHRVLIEDFCLADRPVTCGEFMQFMDDGGYHDPALWLADGWDWVQRNNVRSPLYWTDKDGCWHLYTLAGQREVDPHETLCHVSFYEAWAYAEWAGKRLPTEAEWEVAAADTAVDGHFADHGALHPRSAIEPARLRQLFGDVWEWTASSYASYPGFKPARGAIGEYNGKFMANQMVLRGGSCATPAGHIRPSYRNFFYPPDRWQFTGIRLADSP